MHPRTTEIREFETIKAARAAGFTVSLTKAQAGELGSMNRKQRRQWLAQQRKNNKNQRGKTNG